MTSRFLVIGVGNPLRGDDGAGRAVARAIREMPADAEVIEMEGEGTALLEAWSGAEVAVVIDAVRSGAPPGTVRRFEPPGDRLPQGWSSTSTHALGLPDAVDLGRALGQLPRRLVVYGIEGADFRAGEGLSPAVAMAVPDVAGRVLAERGVLP